jgi:hypothetical protein
MYRPILGCCRRAGAACALLLSAGFIAASPGTHQALSAAPPDYAKIFGRAYKAALEFAGRHPEADEIFRAWDIPPSFAWAIVFPELIRYTALADVIETGNLKVLYVQFGRGYADFSVGHFQMKPSFAETLERDFLRLADDGDRGRIAGEPFNRADTVEARRSRARRLTDVAGQARYLAMFIRVLDKLYAGEIWDREEAKLRFYATAYNAGYRLGAARLRKEMTVPRFHTGLFAGKDVHVYADVAADYFRKRDREGTTATARADIPSP